jgi:hypothetical protein
MNLNQWYFNAPKRSFEYDRTFTPTTYNTYTCTKTGECIPSSNMSGMTLYACKQGCDTIDAAKLYWDSAKRFIQQIKESFEDRDLFEVEFDEELDEYDYPEYDSQVIFTIQVDSKQNQRFQLTLQVEYMKQLDVYHFSILENNLSVYDFTVSTAFENGRFTVNVQPKNLFFPERDYSKQMDADKYLFLTDFIYLGFCEENNNVEVNFSDKMSFPLLFTHNENHYSITLPSFFIWASRGYTYYQNRFYDLDVNESQMVKLAEQPFIRDINVGSIARMILQSNSLALVLVELFSDDTNVNESTITSAIKRFNVALQSFRVKNRGIILLSHSRRISLVNNESINTLIYFKDVKLLGIQSFSAFHSKQEYDEMHEQL